MPSSAADHGARVDALRGRRRSFTGNAAVLSMGKVSVRRSASQILRKTQNFEHLLELVQGSERDEGGDSGFEAVLTRRFGLRRDGCEASLRWDVFHHHARLEAATDRLPADVVLVSDLRAADVVSHDPRFELRDLDKDGIALVALTAIEPVDAEVVVTFIPPADIPPGSTSYQVIDQSAQPFLDEVWRTTTIVDMDFLFPPFCASTTGVINLAAGSGVPADLNCDGLVDAADLGILLAGWGPLADPADINGDGIVDGADLGLILEAWTGS